MIVKKVSSGLYYLCRKATKTVVNGRNWFLVKNAHTNNSGYIFLGHVGFPRELIGKRVRFRIEVLDEDEKGL